MWLLAVLLPFLWAPPAAAENRFIVRSTLTAQQLSQFCLLQSCTVVRGLDGTLNQLFLLTTPDAIDPTVFLTLLRSTPGIVAAELDQLLSMLGGLNRVTTPPASLDNRTPINYYGASVWDGYANQPAALKVRAAEARNTFQVTGAGVVADIDTGVDPNHPALQSVLLPGYDFTRNQANGSEMTDVATLPPPPPCSGCPPAQVNQSTAAVLDQSTAAVLDSPQYAAFGHGTMVLGVVHLVAPAAQLMPLKAFYSDGTGFLSDILRAIYYAAQNGASVINMSFDTKTPSHELELALDYARGLNVISVASAGNDGMQEIVYPAALITDVMGVASTSDLDTRSSFSNFGNAIVWVAAPGEAIVTTYPFGSYSAGWGTSFSAPFVSGTGALLLNQRSALNQALAAAAVAHAKWIGPDMGNGRLDIVQALQVLPPGSSPDFILSAAPPVATTVAGQSANFTLSATPMGGFNQTVTWTCTGAPAAATCTVSPSSIMLDGTNPASVTVTLRTTARSVLPPLAQPRWAPSLRPWVLLVACLAWLLFSTTVKRLFAKLSWKLNWALCTAAVLLVTLLCISCGGGAGTAQGTPQGTYAVDVTGASGSVSHTNRLTLTVN